MTAAVLIVRCFRILLPLLSVCVAARGILSYLPDAGIIAGFLEALTDPLLRPFRALLDAAGVTRFSAVDLSYPAAVCVLLMLARYCAYLLL